MKCRKRLNSMRPYLKSLFSMKFANRNRQVRSRKYRAGLKAFKHWRMLKYPHLLGEIKAFRGRPKWLNSKSRAWSPTKKPCFAMNLQQRKSKITTPRDGGWPRAQMHSRMSRNPLSSEEIDDLRRHFVVMFLTENYPPVHFIRSKVETFTKPRIWIFIIK